MAQSPKMLSKSKILSGVQCEKMLWLGLHRHDLAREVTPAEQARFDAGNEVGEEAQRRFPGGLLIDAPYYDRLKAISQTSEAVDNGKKTLYEATFEHDGVWAKIDILNKKKGVWDLIEVKSSTKVKDTHYLDVAIQAYVLMHQGLPMGKCYLMHLNRDCRYPKLDDLFILEDITEAVEELVPQVQEIANKLKKVSMKTTMPNTPIGPHCSDPYDCTFMDHCWKKFPEDSVFDLPWFPAKKAWALVASGTKKIKDLNEEDFNGVTRRAIEVVKYGENYLDKKSIKEELDQWEWPLYFFDFETLGEPVPRFEGVGPYKAVPFQYSCHVWESPDSTELSHFEYLHVDSSDPRKAIAQSIVGNFGPKGSVVAYNKPFEKGVLQKLGEDLPAFSKPLNQIIDRLVDPLPIFKKNVYQPGFKGSFSIKYVAPTIVGEKLSYEQLYVSDGSEAQATVALLMKNKITDKQEREQIVQALLEYCRQDTMAMVELVKWLFAKVEE